MIIVPSDMFCADVKRVITQPAHHPLIPEAFYTSKIMACYGTDPPSTGDILSWKMPEELLNFAACISELEQQTNRKYVIFTDGSSRRHRIQKIDLLRSDEEIAEDNITSAALVAIADDPSWRKYPCRVLFLRESEDSLLDAHSAEFVALIAASHIQRYLPMISIYSDCSSAISKIVQVCKGVKVQIKSKERTLLEALILSGIVPNIKWVKSHPERRSTDSTSWSYSDWGIYLADAAAEGDIEKISNETEFGYFQIPLTELMLKLAMPGAWFWTDKIDGSPAMASLIHVHAHKRVHEYLEQRDEYRKQRDRDLHARWRGTSLALANRCWRLMAKSFIQRNVMLKHVLDKYWNGRNRSKHIVGAEGIEIAKCRICNAEDSQQHLILFCGHEDLSDIRLSAKENVRQEAELLEREGTLQDSLCARVAWFIYEQAFNASYQDLDRLWLGTWNSNTLSDAFRYKDIHADVYEDISYAMANKILGVITRLTHHLTAAMVQLQKVHSRLCRRLEERDDLSSQQQSQKRQRTERTDETLKVSAELHLEAGPLQQGLHKSSCAHYSTRKKTARVRKNLRAVNNEDSANKVKRNKRRNIKRSREIMIRRKAFQTQDDDRSSDMEIEEHTGVALPDGDTESLDYDRD